MKIRRGDIVWVNLDPTVGDEVAKTRPCLVIQNDLGNRHSKKTIIAPFLKVKNYPFVVNVKPTSKNGLDKERGLDLSHIRSVSIQRINDKLGEIEPKYWSEICQAILVQLGFDEMFT
ncbi:MAG: type II toxin-antitoxin system PemK/MazF family toxin [Waterburya sp.]